MKGRAPAFQFYANDWLSSPKIMLMTPAQEGAYIRLLAIAWSDPDCSLPDNDDELAALSRLGEGWFTGGSSIVRRCFEPHPHKPGRLVNTRLLEERKKQDQWREKSSAGGKKSGETRANSKLLNETKNGKGGSRMVSDRLRPNLNQGPTLQSSSSSSINNLSSTKKGEKDKPSHLADARKDSPAIKACQELAKRYPDKTLWDKLIAVLGDSPNLPLLAECRSEWLECGFNPASWKWATDWYVNGIPIRGGQAGRFTHKSGNGINAANSTPDEFAAEVQRIHESKYGVVVDAEVVH